MVILVVAAVGVEKWATEKGGSQKVRDGRKLNHQAQHRETNGHEITIYLRAGPDQIAVPTFSREIRGQKDSLPAQGHARSGGHHSLQFLTI